MGYHNAGEGNENIDAITIQILYKTKNNKEKDNKI
jgi:hypothetical protein